jgi:osomolarity two-component system, sensor histidine kinase SLN1
MRQYPAAIAGFGQLNPKINNASSMLATKNENNVSVAVGYARPQSTLVSWLLIVEQTHEEAWQPIERLRTIVLACVFGTIGLILIVVWPMAHFSVRPIRRLRDATEKSIAPPGYTPNGSIRSDRLDDADMSGDEVPSQRSRKGIFIRLKNMGSRRKTKQEHHEDQRRRGFKIPGKVQDRKHFVTDELTELTSKLQFLFMRFSAVIVSCLTMDTYPTFANLRTWLCISSKHFASYFLLHLREGHLTGYRNI